jgi:hypothetical protein
MAKASVLGGSIGPLLILFVILGSIILYAIVVSPVERERVFGKMPYERDVINTIPGEIIPMPQTTYSLTRNLASVKANFAPQPISHPLSAQITVKHTMLSDQDAKFTIELNKTNLVDADLEFEIAAKEGDKELIVELNNNVVFSGTPSKEAISIPLPITLLKEGTNTIRISVEPPGFSFSTTAYSLKNIQFIESKYKPQEASATQIFTLTQQELQGLISAKLYGLIRKLAEPSTLSLALNNKTIYSANLYSDTSIDLSLPLSLLNSTNILTWTASKDGNYEITFGQVKSVYAKTSFKTKSYNFFITDLEAQAKAQGAVTCTLEIVASEPISKYLTVQINTYSLNLRLSEGNLTIDVCPYLQPGENTLSIQSQSKITLSKLRLLIAGKVGY